MASDDGGVEIEIDVEPRVVHDIALLRRRPKSLVRLFARLDFESLGGRADLAGNAAGRTDEAALIPRIRSNEIRSLSVSADKPLIAADGADLGAVARAWLPMNRRSLTSRAAKQLRPGIGGKRQNRDQKRHCGK